MEGNTITLQSSQPTHSPAGALGAENRELLIKFRQQIHAVGGVWIFFGVMYLLLGSYVLFSNPGFLNIQSNGAMMLGGLGCVWIALGVYTCRKEMSALTGGLVISYLAVVIGLASGSSPASIAITGAVIIQGHRVRGFAKKLTAEGIALTTKP